MGLVSLHSEPTSMPISIGSLTDKNEASDGLIDAADKMVTAVGDSVDRLDRVISSTEE